MCLFGSVGEAPDSAIVDSFWSLVSNELLDRKHGTTHMEPSNTLFDYIEEFANRRRRHARLGYVSPIEYERTHDQETACCDK